jgi:hypothetical protein
MPHMEPFGGPVVVCHHGPGRVKAVVALGAGAAGFGWWWDKHHPDHPPVSKPLTRPLNPTPPRTEVITKTITRVMPGHPLLSGDQVVLIVALAALVVVAVVFIWGRWIR